MSSIRANVRPAVLEWARKTAGLSVEEAARRIGGQNLRAERLLNWESGESQPTVVQLRKMASVYRRPLATFFLAEIPIDFTLPRDFRRLPGDGIRAISPSLTSQIRRAQERREIALELYDELDEAPPELTLRATLEDDPEQLGGRVREALGVTEGEQTSWRDRTRYKALNQWRKRFEDLGVLVFQFTEVEPSEALGFSIADSLVPIVAVNRKLKLNGRIFTMFHELVHIVLRASGVCDIDEDVRRTPEEQRIEVFCNRVAAAALIPAASLLSAPPALARPGRTADWDDQAIELLAEQFSVSREAIVRRLLTLGRTTAQFYAQKRAQYQAQTIAITETRKDDEGGGGFESPAIKAVSVQGPSYIRLVLESYYQGRITLSDVSSYLGVRTKHLSRIEKAVLAA